MNTHIEEYLYNRNLVDVYAPLKSHIDKTGNWELKEELDTIRNTHETMLRFTVLGIEDPNGDSLYNSLIRQTYILYDRTKRIERLAAHPEHRYVATYKALKEDSSLDNIQLALETLCEKMTRLQKQKGNMRDSIFRHDMEEVSDQHEETLLRMFNQVWTSDIWRKSEYETAVSILHSEVIHVNDIAILVSAATLSLHEMFDFYKLQFLLDAYLNLNSEISQRALVGIVLATRQHERRFHAFPEIATRLSFYKEDARFVKELYTVHTQLQFCYKTESISHKMRDDIMPALLKSKDFKRTDYGIQVIDPELTKNGENPEWYSKKEDDKAFRKMQEMADLQNEGADVYMSTFSHMKSYPFFQQIAHWFYPFYTNHPSIRQTEKLLEGSAGTLIRVILDKSPFCNSDKYSFCFMLNTIGSFGQDMLSQQIAEQLPPGEDINSVIENNQKHKERNSDISRRYIYDLYRFFNVFPFHIQFRNPFADKSRAFTPLTSVSLSFMNEFMDEKLALAEFFMRKEFYDEAEKLFKSFIPQKRETDTDIWQKLGFCQQKQGKYAEAYESYMTADELQPESKWTLTHLAYVASMLREYKTASKCYDFLLKNDPDNIKLLTKKVEMLISTEHFEEALPTTYKLYYLDDKSAKCRKIHAKILFMTGNDLKKAEELLMQAVDEEPEEVQNRIDLAHTIYAQGRTEEAYRMYRTSYKSYMQQNHDEAGYSNLFWKTVPLNNNPHFNIKKMTRMYDAIRMGELGI
ncbi:MAG: hypothetical protein NC206_00020 [Bacteroides sp.]|nr:hypothetical protein [Roseburia sp.]MCM1345463.1 hypothetical protein [Bacteroides sp.]MCM1421801.1 hypothetical protein [Bacteroides sp.]